MPGRAAAEALDLAITRHGKPCSITVDYGLEFTSRALDQWAYQRGVLPDSIRPGRPAEGGLVESFNGKLREEYLNANQFLSIEGAKSKIEAWRIDINMHRPHSELGNIRSSEWMKKVGNEDKEVQIVSV